MKLRALLLTVSLAANAALLVLLWRPHGSTPLPSPIVAPAVIAKNPALDPLLWPTLATSDLPALVARLRAAGFPLNLIRAILTAQIEEQFAARREKITGPKLDLPRWKVPLAEADPIRIQALETLDHEQSDLLKQLLGPDAQTPNPTEIALQQLRYGWLPPAQAARLISVVRDYNELRAEAYRDGTQAEKIAKLAELEKAQRAEFAKLLTPQELADYDLRNSPSAHVLRYTLTHFDPTEAEYRTLHALRQPFDDRFAPGTNDPAKAEAEKALNAQIHAALGDARYTDYLHSTDENYGSISILVSRLALPAAATVQIYDLQKSAQLAAASIQADPTLTPEARATRLAALAAQTTADLKTTLGPAGFAAYTQNNSGRWLQKLPASPRPDGGD